MATATEGCEIETDQVHSLVENVVKRNTRCETGSHLPFRTCIGDDIALCYLRAEIS